MKLLINGIVFLGGVLLPWIVSAQENRNLESWTLEQVLMGISKANGGIESIESVTNARFIGTMETNDLLAEMMILKRRPNLFRSRIVMEERTVETGFDGAVAWRRFEQAGFDKVIEISDPEVIDGIVVEADFDGPLIGNPQQGTSLKLVGVQRINRIDYFVVEVLTENTSTLHYIDSRTFRELKLEKSVYLGDGTTRSSTTTFYDLGKYGGIWVPRRIVKESSDGTMETVVLNKIEINPGILDFAFKVPPERKSFPVK